MTFEPLHGQLRVAGDFGPPPTPSSLPPIRKLHHHAHAAGDRCPRYGGLPRLRVSVLGLRQCVLRMDTCIAPAESSDN